MFLLGLAVSQIHRRRKCRAPICGELDQSFRIHHLHSFQSCLSSRVLPHVAHLQPCQLCALSLVLPHLAHLSPSFFQSCAASRVLAHVAHFSQSCFQSCAAARVLAHLTQSADQSCVFVFIANKSLNSFPLNIQRWFSICGITSVKSIFLGEKFLLSRFKMSFCGE